MIEFKPILPLFIFEMANNHMGSVEHGLRIVRDMHAVSRDLHFTFGVKLQYRDIGTFIHPNFRGRVDLKFVKRFTETRLDRDQFKVILNEIKSLGFLTICTPFDEKSVDQIEEHGIDIVKIGSCSFTDWPLLERIAKTEKPIIASTAGIALEDIDRVVSFFEHRDKVFCLMHCVGEYPTPDSNLQLNQIDLLRHRYPKVTIGFSTHELPNNLDAIKLAVAKGALVFERHVGVPTDQFALNAYSSTPDQVRQWLGSAVTAFQMCGVVDRRHEFSAEELEGLRSLRRGAFAEHLIEKGHRILLDDVFFAIPTILNQLTSNDMAKYTDFTASQDIPADAPLLTENVIRQDNRDRIYKIIHSVKKYLVNSGVPFPPKADLEVSHHYGIERFDEYGLTMITVVNREYCKKLITLLPGQKHPEQFHKTKEETFHILYGDVWVELDGNRRLFSRGEVVTIERGTKHSFCTDHGVIIEEISSTHYVDDSFYTDPAVGRNKNRKTLLTYWFD